MNDIKRKLKSTNIQLKWVKAHHGVIDNERADELAKQATYKKEIDCEFTLSRVQIRNKRKKELITKW